MFRREQVSRASFFFLWLNYVVSLNFFEWLDRAEPSPPPADLFYYVLVQPGCIATPHMNMKVFWPCGGVGKKNKNCYPALGIKICYPPADWIRMIDVFFFLFKVCV